MFACHWKLFKVLCSHIWIRFHKLKISNLCKAKTFVSFSRKTSLRTNIFKKCHIHTCMMLNGSSHVSNSAAHDISYIYTVIHLESGTTSESWDLQSLKCVYLRHRKISPTPITVSEYCVKSMNNTPKKTLLLHQLLLVLDIQQWLQQAISRSNSWILAHRCAYLCLWAIFPVHHQIWIHLFLDPDFN